MSAPAAPLVRLALHVGGDRLDVALTPEVSLAAALWAAGVDVRQPGVVVLDSSGRPLPLDEGIGPHVPDGAVVHVVRPADPQPRGRRASGVVSRRPPAQAGLVVLGGVGGLVAAGAALLAMPAALTGSGGQQALAAVLGLTAVALVAARSSDRGVADAATLAAPALGFAAGALAVDPSLAGGRQLGVAVGLVVAAAVAAARHTVSRTARSAAAELSGVVLVALGVAAAVAAAALLAGLPGALAAAVLVGASPIGLRALPSLTITVPDEQLVDLTLTARTALSVRGPRRPAPPRATWQQVERTVGRAERRKDSGTVLVALVSPLLLPVVLVAPAPSAAARWGSLVLAACVALALALLPRTARGTTARVMPRLAAAAVLLETVLLTDLGGAPAVAAAAVLVVVGLVVAATSLPMGRGWRSVAASRFADGIESLAVVLALPAALVAVDAIALVRAAASG
ncbi:hypothetical protein [Cellulomonas chengniuliangii]|uniref:Type VII secretion integral membrane protein EccD n=1 Tax=Cellulomonas chengniuliangii TaxID=2968084 RepID=A0ABY5L044_9CELL|nr:hypothetical protein [Cellulomonas chengniuliangii]MCC2309575.1 hypothetical protein [Cellulomonas chengniuliangii]MCC2316846.1 hypothetical protein [Cellulomonas chengniuliangii]UUI74872.1 hypothetical protein NP064_13955 [Cellulomonas chengniuliangii]